MSKKKKKGFLGRIFGGKDGEGEAATPGPPAGGDGFDLTMAPGYASPTEGADLTMQPGYAGGPEHFKPESSGETGAVNFGRDLPPGASDPAGAGEMTMAPGYLGTQDQHQAGPHGSHGPGTGAAPVDDFGAGEMTMAPGYLGTQAQHQAGVQPADPFNFDAPAPTAQPGGVPAVDPFGAAPPPATVNPGPVDPFGGGGEMTMAPGYAGGAPASGSALRDPFAEPAAGVPDPFAGPDPFADAAPPAQQPDPFADNNMTMAPGYLLGQPGAGAPAANPAAAAGAAGAGAAFPPGLDPYNPGDAAEMTMVPGYAGSGPAVPDPFNFDMPESGGAPAQAQPLSPAIEAAALGAGADPNDPFGAPLLDDPGPGAPPANPLAAASSFDDFMGEKTLVDMPEDIGQLATLRPSTEELQIDDLGSLAVGESDPLLATIPPPIAPGAGLGATPSTLAAAPAGQPLAQPAGPGVPGGAPAAPTAVARPLFANSSVQHGATVLTDPSPSVVIDMDRGLVFAPARAGGWSNVPAGFEVLSDGSVLGRAFATDAQTVRLPARPQDQVTATDEGLRLPAFPPGVKIDRRTGAVLVPTELEALLSWRPATVHRVEQGLVFLLPEGFRFEEDGTCLIPQPSVAGAGEDDAVASGPSHPTHGRVTAHRTWLGVQEWTHADGWTRVELPADATQAGALVTLPATARRAPGAPPAGLQLETLADEALQFRIPRTGQMAADGIWLAPIPGSDPCDAEEPLADVDATVRDAQTYLGITDELLDNDWVRLTLPDDAQVSGGVLLLPADYAQGADPAILGSFDRTPDGRLRFALPEGSEVLGTRVLIPPPGPKLESPTESWITGDAPVVSPAAQDDHPSGPRKWDLEKERKATGRAKKVSAMDRFRSGKSEPRNDTLDFDGVLPSDDDGAVSTEAETKEHTLAETTEAETTEAETTEAETTEAETTEAETPEAETTEAETTEAETTEADTTEADTTEADTTEADTPEADTPEADTPEADTPEADTPEAETPEAETTEAETKTKKRTRKRRSRKKSKSSEE